VAQVAEVRKAVGDDVLLTVDANGAYDAKTAIHVLKRLEPLGVAMAEQPTGYFDLVGLKRVADAVDMPVMADQVATTAADATELIRREAADLLSIKVMKGGLTPSQKIRAICEGADMPYHLGGIATTRILDGAALHLAAACPAIAVAAEVGEFMGVAGDLASGIAVQNGMLRVPEGPGLGLELAVDHARGDAVGAVTLVSG
jgi:L-alanine-DL-glutamate epimerase-like enolase superfamily enzyme